MTDASDAFDALYQPTEPVEPAADFARLLRAQLESDLGLSATISLPERSPAMTTSTELETRPAVQPVVPYLCVHDGVGALVWYADALGAVETNRWVGDDGRLGHSEFTIGGIAFFLSDEFPEIGVVSPRTLAARR